MEESAGLRLDGLPEIKSLSRKKSNIFLYKSLLKLLLQINELDDSSLKFVCQLFSELKQHYFFPIPMDVYHCLISD